MANELRGLASLGTLRKYVWFASFKVLKSDSVSRLVSKFPQKKKRKILVIYIIAMAGIKNIFG